MGLQQGRLHRLKTTGAWELALIRGCGRRLTRKIYGLSSGRKGSESRTGHYLRCLLHPFCTQRLRVLLRSNAP